MLSPKEVLELKKQLADQIKHLPEAQRTQAQRQIDELSEDALEGMLEEQKEKKPQKTPLRMIIDKELQAYVIADTKVALAVLEIKPLSKGHTLIIPKHKIADATKLSANFFSLAKRIATGMKRTLKAKNIEIQTEAKFGEHIINVIPVYDKPLTGRYDASKTELESVQKLIALKSRTRKPKQKVVQVQHSSLIKLKRRIA